MWILLILSKDMGDEVCAVGLSKSIFEDGD